MPDKNELGPNAKNHETWPGKVPLKDDTAARLRNLGGAALDANKRGPLGKALGSQAVKNTVKDQKKGK